MYIFLGIHIMKITFSDAFVANTLLTVNTFINTNALMKMLTVNQVLANSHW